MFEEIVQHFLSKICTSDEALSDKRCSNPDLLFPPFKEKIDSVIKKYLSNHEAIPEFFETYRSNKRQTDMHASGASDISINGMHHFGIAVDLVTKTEKGKWNWDILDYDSIRSTAKELGLSLLNKEDCHIQLIPIAKQTTLRRAIFQGVKDFQKEHGLKSDGIVGLKTIAALKIAYTPKTEIE